MFFVSLCDPSSERTIRPLYLFLLSLHARILLSFPAQSSSVPAWRWRSMGWVWGNSFMSQWKSLEGIFTCDGHPRGLQSSNVVAGILFWRQHVREFCVWTSQWKPNIRAAGVFPAPGPGCDSKTQRKLSVEVLMDQPLWSPRFNTFPVPTWSDGVREFYSLQPLALPA